MDIKKIVESLDNEDFKNELRELTDYNEHTKAMLLVATHYNLEKYIEEFTSILEEQEKVGYLDSELADKRYSLFCEMFEELAKLIGSKEANEIRSCL